MSKPLGAKVVHVLTAIQTWRIGGGLFIVGTYQGWLPVVFGLIAGWGDLLVGATAPVVGYALMRRRGLGTWVSAIVWNALGIMDLVVAVSVGVLSNARAMLEFPLYLVPYVAVPTLIAAHLITVALLGQRLSGVIFLECPI